MADNELKRKLESLRSGGRGAGSITPVLGLITALLKE